MCDIRTSKLVKIDLAAEDDNNCPICATIPTGKIFQCGEGHVLCESCLHKIERNASRTFSLPMCPSCGIRLDGERASRCRVLEKLLDRLKIDCRFFKNGCQEKLTRSEYEEHEASCIYGFRVPVCRMFVLDNCNFELTVESAKMFMQHIESCHPTTNIRVNRAYRILNFNKVWRGGVAAGNKINSFSEIIQVANSPKYVMLIIKVTKHLISFQSVDVTLGLSTKDKLWVNFVVELRGTPLLSWSFPVSCGITSWEYLRSNDESCHEPIEIGIQSLLKHSDDEGNLKFIVEVAPRNNECLSDFILLGLISLLLLVLAGLSHFFLDKGN